MFRIAVVPLGIVRVVRTLAFDPPLTTKSPDLPRHRRHDLRSSRRLEAGAAVIGGLLTGIAAIPWVRAALRYCAIVLAVLLFLVSLRRSGERAGRLVERLETTEKANDVQRQMLEAAARRPRDRNELAQRLRDGEF
jgi:hypothetical protein